MCKVKNSEELIKRAEAKDKSEYGMNQIKVGFSTNRVDITDPKVMAGRRILEEKVLNLRMN